MCVECIICGKKDYPVDTKKFPKDFCSYKCYEEWQKWHKEPNCEWFCSMINNNNSNISTIISVDCTWSIK